MHLFASNTRYCGVVYDVYQWNAVDVLINGALQHGVVIGLASGDNANQGLLIDFDCPQRHCELVEYGNLFSCPSVAIESWKERAWTEIYPLQALLRVGPQRAWTWWPVQLVLLEDSSTVGTYCSDIDCALVEVRLGDATMKVIVPVQQIRIAPSSDELQQRRLPPHYFVNRECSLPGRYWSVRRVADGLLWQQLSRDCSACCTAVVRQSESTLLYFQQNDGQPLTPAEFEGVCDHVIQECSERGLFRGVDQDLAGEWIGRRFVTPAKTVQAPLAEPGPAGRGIPLPREILAEVFQSLDTIERIRLRRVCRLWEAVVSGDATAGQHLWISFRKRHVYRSEQFLLAGCLLKCATPATTTVVIEDASESLVSASWAHVRTALQKRCLKTLVFSQCDFSERDVTLSLQAHLERTNKEVSALAATCGAVVWRACDMSLRETRAHVAHARFYLRDAAAQRLVQVWDAFERSLVLRKAMDLPRLAAWVDGCVRVRSWRNDACAGFLRVLNESIGADPRAAQNGVPEKWTRDNVDVYKLSKVAQLALDCYLEKRLPYSGH